ncbi:MAG: hypothetical protein CMM87_04120 [Rickettsiales bacterium]|nr:hypothetical protein [Rickettsiales bacterium]
MKIKSLLIIIAILGLVSVCSYLAYLYGTQVEGKAVIPVPLSSAEKQIKSTKEAIAKKKAELSKADKEKTKADSKSSQASKSDSPNSGGETKQIPGQEKVQNKNEKKEKNTDSKAESHKDENHKKIETAKPVEPKQTSLTNEQLKLKLERYYKTGKLTESPVQKNETINYRLQRYFIRGGLDNYDRTKIWHEISLHDEGRKIDKEDKYSDLSKLPKNFSVEAIRKSYGEKTPLEAKNYAVLIEKVIKRPWYSRVFY